MDEKDFGKDQYPIMAVINLVGSRVLDKNLERTQAAAEVLLQTLPVVQWHEARVAVGEHWRSRDPMCARRFEPFSV